MNELENVVRRLKSPSPEEAAEVVARAKAEREPASGHAAAPDWVQMAGNTQTGTGAASNVTPLSAHRAEAVAAAPVAVAATQDRSADASEHTARGGRDGPGGGALVTFLGAVCSVALVVGVSVWTYKLGQRDAMEVPVIKAMAEPARIEPDDPGGLTTPHQGLAVNRVLEGGGVRPVARSVRTAPVTDTVTEEDLSPRDLAALSQSETPVARPAATPVDNTPKSVGSASLGAADFPASRSADLSDEKVQAAKDDGDIAPTAPGEEIVVTTRPATPALGIVPNVDNMPVAVPPPGASAQTGTTPDPVADGPIPAVGEGSQFAPATVAARAAPRPARAVIAAPVQQVLAAAVDAAVAEATAPTTAAAVAANTGDPLASIPLPVGTRLIQLGAYDSEATARAEWNRFSRAHSDLLSGKDYYVQRIQNSGRTFYRLRVAGYAQLSDSRAACSALASRGVPCITATVR